MPETTQLAESFRLFDAALALLHRRFAGERVEVSDETRPLYSGLVAAGLMMPLHTFALGPNSAYRLTDAACICQLTRREEENRTDRRPG